MQNRVILFLVMIAVIIAIAFFLLISFLLRPAQPQAPVEAPTGEGEAQQPQQPQQSVGQPYVIGGTEVIINADPLRRVHIVAPEAQQPAPTQTQPSATLPLPTATLPLPTATSAPAPAGPVAGVEQIVLIDYVVQPEDTLYRITQKHQTSIELMAEHNIASGNLVTGNTIRLPVANAAYCAGSQAYLVRPNDTVFSIARRHGVTKEAIAQLNNLGADYRININQVLCIP
ncbi:MAG: LysM peptidoglycan-binding domain-containing protein [Candidatus Promineifilaceae bacterium]|nr:LysM peptidoglycan-binding domain-containing protein [Candidatus Promineifilaceae bacterium]